MIISMTLIFDKCDDLHYYGIKHRSREFSVKQNRHKFENK